MDSRASMLGLGAAIGLVLVIAVGLLAPPVARPSAPMASVPSLAAPSSAAPPILDGMAVEDVYRRFAAGGPATAGGEPVDLSTERVGELLLQTGRVVASDVSLLDPLPFSRWLLAGRRAVFALHAIVANRRDDRIASALIRVAPGDPVQWEMALTAGQNPGLLQPGQFFGYGVDSGIGCFASAEAAEWLADAGFAAEDDFSARLSAVMFPSRNEIHPVADIPVGDPKGLNVIAFASGWGDGLYPSYFGLDDSGRPIVLMTDFQILDAS